jgi:tryptophan synthase alpha subunit
LPVCAGFGVRHADQVANLGKHASGVIVGSALVERLEAGEDPAAFLAELRPRCGGFLICTSTKKPAYSRFFIE